MLGLNWKDWSKTLHESIEDIADVQQLFTTLAVPMNTLIQLSGSTYLGIGLRHMRIYHPN